ncbi:MAG: AAA family ATPase [Paludibacteraceae bacterium]|nr:AAA family ATPase [Prevotella sp.]MBQ8705864.1 AAA family ATPase [Paludibacteraceae bacterium]MBQ8714473.1 AAA family ATPase [Prevotella sp.]
MAKRTTQQIDTDNREWQQALQIVEYTRRSLFLTGKAGTGKSTFLRYVAQNTKKKHVILAPTGIAAINAGGQTLHSFFKLPFHPLLPNDSRYNIRNIRKTLKYSGITTKLLRELELIIIDEISMVRADIIDFIDKVLRIYCRNMREPFGGKQLLLVGDIFQLEPVVKEDEWRLMQPFYASAYFFSAKVWQEMQLVSIELRKVYRQSDARFISLLDRIRQNQTTAEDLKAINERVSGDSKYTRESGDHLAITLATRRDTVDYINEQRLAELDGAPSVFHGTITGEFPVTSLPAPMELEVKPGAQVIFIKNDKERRWVNGTLGVVIYIDEEEGIITVVDEDGHEYDVEREIWENMRYTFNEKEQKIEEEQLGTFIQFPLRLAWAITVHKSQGLTFRQVKIDFSGGGAFAGGQTYVALSRCTSLEGITLEEPIRQSDIFVRAEVVSFAHRYNDGQLIQQAMYESKADKEYHDAVAAFDRQDFDGFLRNFFLAIHSRYDIEKPAAQRLIRRKLGIITKLQQECQRLEGVIASKEETLRRLAAEYVLMGKECEREHMPEAAIRNYEKALELYPDAMEAQRRIKKLKKDIKK